MLITPLHLILSAVVVSDQLYGKSYYQPEHYVSKRMLETMALPTLKEELPRLHARHAQMLHEEAEIEYLNVRSQQPPACGLYTNKHTCTV